VVEDLVERVISLLHDTVASEKQLTRHIARALSKMLASFQTSINGTSLIAIPATQIHSSTIQNIEYEGRGQSNNQMTQNGKTENGSVPLIKNFDFGTGSSFNESCQGFPTTTAKERRGSMLESMSMHS
jgi:hypothetical protein